MTPYIAGNCWSPATFARTVDRILSGWSFSVLWGTMHEQNESDKERANMQPLDEAGQLKAAAVIRKLNGNSESVMMLASDGFLYVVKMAGSPQGPNILANEA